MNSPLWLSRLSILGVLTLATHSSLQAQDRSRSTYLISGSILMEDGRPFPDQVEVVLTCSGAVLKRTHSGLNGGFSFQLADNRSPTSSDLETAGSPSGGGFRTFNQMGRGMGDSGSYGSGRSSKFGRLNLSDCEIVATLPGYRSDIIYPGIRDVLDKPDIGAITLRQIARGQGTTVSLNTLQAPSNAVRAYRRAQEHLEAKRPNLGRVPDELSKAVDLYPGFSAAWYLLGNVRRRQSDSERAIESYRRAVESEPGFLLPYLTLSELYLEQGLGPQAATMAESVLNHHPGLPRASYLFGYAHFLQGNFPVAAAFARRVQESQEADKFPGTLYILGTVLANEGEFRSASIQLCRFLELEPGFPGAGELKRNLNEWQKADLADACQARIAGP